MFLDCYPAYFADGSISPFTDYIHCKSKYLRITEIGLCELVGEIKTPARLTGLCPEMFFDLKNVHLKYSTRKNIYKLNYM